MTFTLPKDRTFVIAEAGTCHAGPVSHRLMKARAYVAAAASAGADAIKFQMFDEPSPETMFCWIDGDEARAERWRESRLSLGEWHQVKDYAEGSGKITFLASAFEHETVGWLKKLGVSAYKVASRAARDYPYRDAPGPFIVSDGMHKPPRRWADYRMQCEANYPSTSWWKGKGGFSDHSGNPKRAIRAIADGCPMIELHFYVSRDDAGPDLPASLDVKQLALVCDVRDAFAA